MDHFRKTQLQPENPFAAFVSDQQIATVPHFTLESGVALYNVPVACTTRGKLNKNADNAMIICHALTGSANVDDCPYGTASPVTAKHGNLDNARYGPAFPLATIRDDIKLHKLLLDDLGVKQVATVIGGSLGGMLALEWAYLGKDYIRSIVTMASSSQHSAWGISWGEAQRQSIYADPKFRDGYYALSDPPSTGLAAARMTALLTYRSRDSFETRFGRHITACHNGQTSYGQPKVKEASAIQICVQSNSCSDYQTFQASGQYCTKTIPNSTSEFKELEGSQSHRPASTSDQSSVAVPATYSAQSYLRYQGNKFAKRFDNNCYIALTHKLDTHDVSRGRTSTMAEALGQLEQPVLVLGIENDGLFTFSEQKELAQHIEHAKLRCITSSEGHDAFLFEFEQINSYILGFLEEILPDTVKRADSTEEDAGMGIPAA